MASASPINVAMSAAWVRSRVAILAVVTLPSLIHPTLGGVPRTRLS